MLFLDLSWKLLNLLRNSVGVLLLACLSAASWADSTPSSAEAVDAFHAALLQMMHQDNYRDRVQTADEAVRNYFATQTISRISLGSRTWRQLDDETQGTFSSQIHALIATTYASRFDSYDSQTFNILQTEVISDDRQRVRSELITRSEIVSLDYQLQNQDGRWRIYDVAANGVSDLSLKRSNYAALLKQGGIDAVTRDIQQEIAENESNQGE